MRARRHRAPDRFPVAAAASAVFHAAILAAAFLWFGRAPVPPASSERGVEIVWEEAAGEAVGETAEPAAPGAPPSPPAPEAIQAPEAPGAPAVPPPPPQLTEDQLRPPTPPPLPPPAPRVAEVPSVPMPTPELPPLEAPRPELAAIPPAPPAPELPPSGEPEAPPPPPPAPPPAAPPPSPPRSRMARQPPAEPTRPGGAPADPSLAGVGRATGAVVPPGLDTSFRNAAPTYPEASRLRGEQGAVGLELSVDAGGRVTAVVVARSSGWPSLDAAARSAVAAWRFRPATTGTGQPVAGNIRTTIHFRLQ